MGANPILRGMGSEVLSQRNPLTSHAGRTAVVAEDVGGQRRPPPVTEAEAAGRAVAAAAGAQTAVTVLFMQGSQLKAEASCQWIKRAHRAVSNRPDETRLRLSKQPHMVR